MLSAHPTSLHGEPYYVKTPARGTRDRSLLQENLHRIPLTVNAKGKALQTPRRALTVQSHKALSHTAKPAIRVQRPLGDKTPAPNRVANAIPFDTPAPQTAKLAKLSLLEAPQQAVSEPLLRPSSARKSLRAPRTSGGVQQLDFKTPVTRGDHWNVSDGEIDLGADECVEEIADVRGEDDDEIEYMPPTAIVPVYEPPFEMPDYTQLGATIRELAHSYKFDDTNDLYHALDANLDVGSEDLWRESGFASAESASLWEMPKLPPLENELLVRERSVNPKSSLPMARAPAVMQHKHASSLPVIHSTSATRSIPVANTKAPSGRSQPATRAPSRTASTTTTTTTTTASSSRSTAHPTSVTHSNNPSASSRLTSVRPRSQTTSQMARSVSVTVARPEAIRVGTCAASREATTRPGPVMTRSKTTTSVHATTGGSSRATSSAEVAPKQAPARPAVMTAKPTAAISRPATRAAPTSSRINANTIRAVSSATTVKAGQKQAAESASGKRAMAAAAVAATTPKSAAPDAGDLFHFDDGLANDESFIFEV